jgi:hypothetical protein
MEKPQTKANPSTNVKPPSTTPLQVRSGTSCRLLEDLTETCIGRVSSHGFIPKYAAFSSARDTASSSGTAAAPDNILFRRKHAPQRFAEHDIYFANVRQSISKDLPDSDLLKALHCYASDYYSRTQGDLVDSRSMDETALIALGILMEEALQLEQTADLALTEGRGVEDHDVLFEASFDRTPATILSSDYTDRPVKRPRTNK